MAGPHSLQAVILAGGQGTRLRPLTLARAKPVVPLLNRPFLAYQLALLRAHGVSDVVLACSYRVDDVRAALGDAEHLGVRLRYVVEQTIVRVCSAPFVRQGPLQVVWLTVTCAAAGRGARRITANTAAAQTRNTRRERDTTVIERSFLTGASRAAGGPRV